MIVLILVLILNAPFTYAGSGKGGDVLGENPDYEHSENNIVPKKIADDSNATDEEEESELFNYSPEKKAKIKSFKLQESKRFQQIFNLPGDYFEFKSISSGKLEKLITIKRTIYKAIKGKKQFRIGLPLEAKKIGSLFNTKYEASEFYSDVFSSILFFLFAELYRNQEATISFNDGSPYDFFVSWIGYPKLGENARGLFAQFNLTPKSVLALFKSSLKVEVLQPLSLYQDGHIKISIINHEYSNNIITILNNLESKDYELFVENEFSPFNLKLMVIDVSDEVDDYGKDLYLQNIFFMMKQMPFIDIKSKLEQVVNDYEIETFNDSLLDEVIKSMKTEINRKVIIEGVFFIPDAKRMIILFGDQFKTDFRFRLLKELKIKSFHLQKLEEKGDSYITDFELRKGYQIKSGDKVVLKFSEEMVTKLEILNMREEDIKYIFGFLGAKLVLELEKYFKRKQKNRFLDKQDNLLPFVFEEVEYPRWSLDYFYRNVMYKNMEIGGKISEPLKENQLFVKMTIDNLKRGTFKNDRIIIPIVNII